VTWQEIGRTCGLLLLFPNMYCFFAFSALTLLVGRQEGHPARRKNMGGWWRWALVSPDGVAPSRIVSVSVSVNLPLHHKVQKFSSGTGSPGWSRKKGHKTVVVVVAVPNMYCFFDPSSTFVLFSVQNYSGRPVDYRGMRGHSVMICSARTDLMRVGFWFAVCDNQATVLDSLKTAHEKYNDVDGLRETKFLIERLYKEHDELDAEDIGDLSDENDDDDDDDDDDEDINLDEISDDSGLVVFAVVLNFLTDTQIMVLFVVPILRC